MTFLCSGKLEWGWEKKVLALTDERYAALRAGVPRVELPEVRPDDASGLKKVDMVYSDRVMDGDEVEAWTSAGVEVTMTRLRGLMSNSRDLAQTVYQISVSGVGLLQIAAIIVEEDACTDGIQDLLDAGWRILAVCPPNDARRPSYVLGHAERSMRRM